MGLFTRTEAEKKRDSYKKLRDKLKKKNIKINGYLADLWGDFMKYKRIDGTLSEKAIPSDVFEPKRIQLTSRLEKYIEIEDEKVVDIQVALGKAEERYEYYRDLAEREAQEEHEKNMKKMRELWEGLVGGK